MTTLRTVIILAAVVLITLASTAPGQDGRIRIFVMDSQSWEVSGGAGGGRDVAGGGMSGGARPQTTEIMKTFTERCPSCIVTIDRGRAEYTVRLDHEGGKALIRRDNKVVVFNKEGDLIYSGSTRTLGNAVKNACAAIERDRLGRP